MRLEARVPRALPAHDMSTFEAMRLNGRLPGLRPFVAAGLLLLGCTLTWAQAPKTAAHKLLFWEATSGPNTVYLLGSIHVGSKDMYPLPKVINDGFNKSKVLVVEINLNAVDMSTTLKLVQEKGMYTNGDNLWNHLSKGTTAKVKKYFSDYGMDPDYIGTFRPWFIGLLAETVPLQKAGLDFNLGIDMHFLGLAQGKKEIVQAESVEFQLNLLASLPTELTDTYLSWTIDSQMDAKQDAAKVISLWKAGEADTLAAALDEHPKALDKIMRAMLQDRNPHMADVAEKYLKGGGPCFFVVGAGHLVGQEGVIAILRKRGYKVVQESARQ